MKASKKQIKQVIKNAHFELVTLKRFYQGEITYTVFVELLVAMYDEDSQLGGSAVAYRNWLENNRRSREKMLDRRNSSNSLLTAIGSEDNILQESLFEDEITYEFDEELSEWADTLFNEIILPIRSDIYNL